MKKEIMKIALIEDNQIIVKKIIEYYNQNKKNIQENFEFDCFENDLLFFDNFKLGKYDLIITDYELGEYSFTNGIGIIEEVLKKELIPVILMTGMAKKGEIATILFKKSTHSKMIDYIDKKIDDKWIEFLFYKMNNLLKNIENHYFVIKEFKGNYLEVIPNAINYILVFDQIRKLHILNLSANNLLNRDSFVASRHSTEKLRDLNCFYKREKLGTKYYYLNSNNVILRNKTVIKFSDGTFLNFKDKK